MILLKDIEKIYGKGDNSVRALSNINLEIRQGEMIGIIGSSGSGKSTLLNVIGCIDKPTSGSYYLNEESIINMKQSKLASLRNRYFGFIVQHFALIDDYSVFQNINIPLEYTKTSRTEKKEKIIDIAEKLGIADKIKKYPNELSGGQCQRVAIARALVNSPEVILADEPTGSLDQVTGKSILEIFTKLNNEGKTIIIITHDEKVASYCNRIIEIEDGRILKDK